MKFRQVIALFMLFSFASACGKSESITPFAQAKKTAQQQGQDSEYIVFSAKYRFDDVDVQRPNTVPLPILGPVLNEVGNIFAGFFLVLSQNWEVDQEAPEIELPFMDLDVVHSIEIKRVRLTIIPGSIKESNNPLVKLYQWLTFKKAKLDFIKSIDILISNDDLLNSNDVKLRLGKFDSTKQSLDCEKKCMELQMHRDSDQNKFLNLVPLMKGQRKLYLFPKVEVKAIPKRTFKVAVEMDFEIKLHLPF
ncbi:MAG: hypothetical protein COW00_19030 [Bdellovibrio sp. CG12_big_fil_rev_8_21_14_0_65_39_13]|nr:MAG: hypothetical protein COW78_17245 [Bdellovibrio sp. CG22_combo_CG10-13_8_21_14_all_39_27]PIQ57791.1 MAG: hypothetical protein COW00_19030 [Bdellovibrio sp. CG12_big_fil_rev_8_21_14_0_65_39_13]PIR34665.1 MAG: hypothetical protein COV37_12080 [Bdellovibrio sp. CG11_big_fil_rev_8_21_14_0_20_39_38]PJB54102.1 MAG: hypothetical protein CO099_03440 [Bdellovibrio sp. CG_4_9_14_3_um_filter_39_7]